MLWNTDKYKKYRLMTKRFLLMQETEGDRLDFMKLMHDFKTDLAAAYTPNLTEEAYTKLFNYAWNSIALDVHEVFKAVEIAYMDVVLDCFVIYLNEGTSFTLQ